MNFQQCPHCRITVLPNADQICPSCRQVIPVLDAIPVEDPVGESPVESAATSADVAVESQFVPPIDPVGGQSVDLAATVIVPRENIGHQRYRPEPGFLQSLALIAGLFMLAGLFGGILGGVYGLITRNPNLDDYVPLGMAAGSLAAFFLAWSGTQPQPAKALAMVRANWRHLVIACLLPLPAQLVFTAGVEVVYRAVPQAGAPANDAAQIQSPVKVPIAAIGNTIAAQSWRERIFSQYDILARKSWFVVLLVGCFLPAVCEEMFFRGYLGRGLLAQLGLYGGVFVTSLLFGVVHLEPGQIIFTGLLGIMLHTLYLCSKSIWPSMLMHFVNNVLAFGSMKMMHAGQLPVQANGTLHIPWYVTLASSLVLIALLRLLYATRISWHDAEGALIDYGYPTAEVPSTFPSQRRQATASFVPHAFSAAALLLLAGTSLTSLYQNQGTLTAWRAVNAGDAASMQGKHAQAMKHYQDAIKHDPLMPEGYCGRALAAIALNEPEPAKIDASHALKLRPRYPVALAALAESKLLLGDIDAACDDANRACEQDPKNYYPYMVRARCEAAQGHSAAALATSRQAKRLSPQNVEIRLWRCHFLTQCHDVKLRNPMAAIAELTSSDFTMPNIAECHFALASAYVAQNKIDEAIDELNAALSLLSENMQRDVEYSRHHLRQVGKTLVELRAAWGTPWIDDVIMLTPSRRLIVIVPESQFEVLRDKTIEDLPAFKNWNFQIRTQATEMKESQAAAARLQKELGEDFAGYAESIVTFAARSREELAACDVAEFAKAFNNDTDLAQTIIAAARQAKP